MLHAFAFGLAGGALGVLRLSASAEAVFALTLPLGFTLLASALTCALAARTVLSSRRVAPFVALWFGLLGGALWTLLACQSHAERAIDARLVGEDTVLTGRVVGVPRHDGHRLSFDFEVEPSAIGAARPAADDGRAAGDGGPPAGNGERPADDGRHPTEDGERSAKAVDDPSFGAVQLAPRRLRLSRYGGGAAIAAGERWQLTVRLRAPSGLRNAGGFDRVRHLIASGIDATGQVRSAPPPRRLATARGLDATRERLAERLAALDDTGPGAIAGDGRSRAVALAQALTLGIAHTVPGATRELLRDSGTAHLLAISGLHVTLLAGWGLWLGRALARAAGAEAGRAAAIGLGTALALAMGYALLAGFGLPTRRALAMLFAVLVATARFRVLPPGTALALALVGVLLVDPLAPLSVGFWLSFGAVGALVWLHAGRVGAEQGGRLRRLVGIARTHCLLGIVLLPATAWFFQSGAWIAPLANAVAVPFVGLLIVPLAFATLALAVAWPTGGGLALAALDTTSAWLFDFLAWLLERLDGSWTLALPSLEALLWCLLGLALLLAPRGAAPRALALVLLFPAVLANVREPRPAGFEVHVLDVGQGLAALVLSGRETWLYDTGGRLTPSLSMLEAVVVPYLHALGRRRVDAIVVSHPDSDHAAGLEDALARWPRARLFVGVRTDDTPAAARDCRAGDTQLVDGVRFSFLHPAAHDTGSENDRSCVLLVHHGVSRALLTGDIERAAEARLVHRLGGLPVTLMSAPHHGSRTSSGAALLRALSPAHVVFPAGAGNAFGFPHEEVQMRYKVAGAVTHVTGRDGALRFAFGPDGLIAPPESWRGTQRRFWHDMVEPPCPRNAPTARITAERASRSVAAPTPGQSSCGR